MNYAVEELEEDVHPRHKTLAEQRRLKLRDVKYVYKKEVPLIYISNLYGFASHL